MTETETIERPALIVPASAQVPAVQQGVRATDVALTRRGNRFVIAPENLGEVIKFAELMARSSVAVPPHLRENTGACLAIVSQALGWEFDPFAVANKSYSVNDRLAYEAQLIAAVVNMRSGIEGRLKYRFDGEGAVLKVIVTGKLDGEVLDYESPLFKEITTKNSPLWKVDPRQQFGYYGARSWARRHVPEVILGVYTKEEVEEFKDITPADRGSGLVGRLSAAKVAPQGGFDPHLVESEIKGNGVVGQVHARRYFYHPESESFLTTDDGSIPVGDGHAEELSKAEYDAKLAEIQAGDQLDPEIERAGASAAVDGEPRRVPDDLSPADAVAWLNGFDAVTRGAQ